MFAAGCDGDGAVFRFLVAEDQDERVAGIVELLHLVAHVAVGFVNFHADAGFAEHMQDLFGVFVVRRHDRHDPHLIR